MALSSLPIFGGVFTFRLIPTFATLVMLTVLIGLGSWQVERLHWKENLIATIHDRMAKSPVDVRSIAGDGGDSEYLPLKATGRFLNDKAMYMNAISLTGEGGYHVLVPMRLKNGSF